MMTQAQMTVDSIVMVEQRRRELEVAIKKKLANLSDEELQPFIESQKKWREYVEAVLYIIDKKFEGGTARVCAKNGIEEMLIFDRLEYLF
jgi:hypothetical protein